MDDAFAGSMCRCPYCSELLLAPGGSRGSAQDRPAAPSLRPDAPAAPKALDRPEAHATIPVARPVRVRGWLALAAVVLILALTGLAVFLAITARRNGQPGPGPKAGGDGPATREAPTAPEPEPDRPQTAVNGGPTPPPEPEPDPAPVEPAKNVAGAAIEPPVAYCVGLASPRTFDRALARAMESAGTLDENDAFTMVLAGPDGSLALPGGYVKAGRSGLTAAELFLANVGAAGWNHLPDAVERAVGVSPKPRTVVIFLAAALEPERTDRIVAAADKAEARLVVVSMSRAGEANAALKALAERPKAGGTLVSGF